MASASVARLTAHCDLRRWLVGWRRRIGGASGGTYVNAGFLQEFSTLADAEDQNLFAGGEAIGDLGVGFIGCAKCYGSMAQIIAVAAEDIVFLVDGING